MYKQAGNSIVVDVMLAVVREIIKTGAFDSQLVESYNMENLISTTNESNLLKIEEEFV